jgi:hypothetical protein
MASVTNTTAAPALRGQGAKITLSKAEAATYLSTLIEGQTCTVSSSSNTGQVYSIDLLGNSFIVTPTMPSGRFDSDTPGVLKATETITF